MREYIRGRLEKAVHNYDTDRQSQSLVDFIQANVRLSIAVCFHATVTPSSYSVACYSHV